MGVCRCGFGNVWVCVCVDLLSVGVCVCVDFVKCECVYVWN